MYKLFLTVFLILNSSFLRAEIIEIGSLSEHLRETGLWINDTEAMEKLDKDTVHKARLDQNDAIASGDMDRVASFWTDDIILRRGLGTHVIGKEAYQTSLGTLPNGNRLIYERIPDSIEVSPHWPLAYEAGTWTARHSIDGPAVITGRYSAQWVKREGRWLIRSELFVALSCSDDPANWPALP